MADEDRIVRVARALCAADGLDPDAMINLGDVRVPAWTSYDGEARRFIAAARAMGLVE